jgi:hypothetical protein
VTSEPDDRVRKLTAYFADNQASLTHEALAKEARGKGYSEAEIAAASQAAEARRAPDAAARARARRVVLVLYLVTYVVLSAGMLMSSRFYGAGWIGVVILTALLGIALAVSLAWIRRSRLDPAREGPVAALVALPLVLLGAVAGLCVFTAGPSLFQVA